MEINNTLSRSYDVTDNGTSVITAGNEVDKDIFLKMLVAQMTNQDPFNPQDPTQYVTQLAQFSMLEQMMSLNDGMEYLLGVNNGMLVNSAVETATTLIGKNVELSQEDSEGNLVDYSGTVKSVSIKDGTVYLEVELDDTGEVKELLYSSIVKINENNNLENEK